MSDAKNESPAPVIPAILTFFLLFCSPLHSEESLPLVGEQVISPGNKVCVYGKGKKVAASRQPELIVCSAKMDKRPGSDERIFILVN